MNCPTCLNPLGGLGRYCFTCQEYVVDMHATTDVTPEARERIKDTRSEKEIQLATRRALDILGYTVLDMSQDRPTRQPAGVPDLYVQGHGVTAWIEMKKPGGVTSEDQKAFISREAQNGGNALVAYSETEAIEWIERLRRSP